MTAGLAAAAQPDGDGATGAKPGGTGGSWGAFTPMAAL
jgi:hypothetical protein